MADGGAAPAAASGAGNSAGDGAAETSSAACRGNAAAPTAGTLASEEEQERRRRRLERFGGAGLNLVAPVRSRGPQAPVPEKQEGAPKPTSQHQAGTATREAPAPEKREGAPEPTGQHQAGAATREVKLPVGWEGLSIKLRGRRCFVSEVPKACFSSTAKVEAGTIKNQVDGVAVGDEIVTLNGETPAKLIERISTAGDAWNACSSASPAHAVGSKTKFDSPPCAACDFIRRRRALGFDVALQMWLRAVKREINFTLGVRTPDGTEPEDDGPPLDAGPEPQQPHQGSEQHGGLGSAGALDDRPQSTVVTLQASSESHDRMTAALERIAKMAAQDDATRQKKHSQKGAGKGKSKSTDRKGRPSGPYLERTRLTDALVIGEVLEWKTNFGWIKPHKPIDHPKAKIHKGKLYVHKVDLEYWVTKLTPGSFCRFHVYSDANSLGAEEVTELKDVGDTGDDAPAAEERRKGSARLRGREPDSGKAQDQGVWNGVWGVEGYASSDHSRTPRR